MTGKVTPVGDWGGEVRPGRQQKREVVKACMAMGNWNLILQRKLWESEVNTCQGESWGIYAPTFTHH